MTTSKINRKLVLTSFAILVLVAAVGVGAYFWQHGQVNSLNKQLKVQKSMYSKLESSNSSLQQENKSLSGKLNGANQSLSSATKIYHVGDTQDGVTLVGVYHSSYQDLMAGNGPTPPTIYDTLFALSGVSNSDAQGHSAIMTTDGTYITGSDSKANTSQCGSNACVGFIVADSESKVTISPKYFLYKGLQWQL